MTIYLRCTSKCWIAHFQEINFDLLLPFLSLDEAVDDLRTRWPEATITYEKVKDWKCALR
jgi:hypothetical protein